MGKLDKAARTMAGAGGELRIVITKPRKRRQHLELFLEIVRSDGYLRIFEDLDEALAAPRPDWKPQMQPGCLRRRGRRPWIFQPPVPGSNRYRAT